MAYLRHAVVMMFLLVGVLSGSILPNEGSGLIPLGTLRLKSGTTRNFEESDYFVSENPTSWNTANNDCVDHGYTLVSLDSHEEVNGINRMLVQYGTGTLYWTGGQYDRQSGSWRWSNTNNPIMASPPWAPNNPMNNILFRIAVQHLTADDSYWRTVQNTQLHRYICEIVHPPVSDDVPVPCYETNDLVLVLDSSGSIGVPNYDIAKDFVARLALAYMGHNENRVGFVIYSNTASRIFDLQNVYTAAQMNATIWGAPFMSYQTYTNVGITMAANFLTSNTRGFPQNMVILTDGQSNDRIATKAAADLAIANGIRTFSVGITDSVNQQELLGIAGGKDDAVFYTDDFDQLLALLRPLSIEICDN